MFAKHITNENNVKMGNMKGWKRYDFIINNGTTGKKDLKEILYKFPARSVAGAVQRYCGYRKPSIMWIRMVIYQVKEYEIVERSGRTKERWKHVKTYNIDEIEQALKDEKRIDFEY